MHARRGLIRHPKFSPAYFLLALVHARLEHNLERPHLLVGHGDGTPSQFSTERVASCLTFAGISA